MSRAVLVGASMLTWLVGAMCPWWRSGLGAALRPHEVAGVILAGHLGGEVPRLWGVVPLLPVVGLALALAMLTLRVDNWCWVVQGLLAVLCVIFVLLLPGRGPVGGGGYALFAVCGVCVLGVLAPVWSRRRFRPAR